MKKSLLRFGIAVLVVLALVFATDRVIGTVMNNLLPMISNHGDSGKTYFSLHDVNTPIVIVGSSISLIASPNFFEANSMVLPILRQVLTLFYYCFSYSLLERVLIFAFACNLT